MDPQEPIIEDVNQSTNAYIKKNDKFYIFLYVVIDLAAIAAIIYFQLSFVCLMVPLGITLAGYTHVQSKIRKEFLQQYATSIGFTYSPTGSLDSVQGRFFQTGHSQLVYDVFTGIHEGRASRIFCFNFTVGSGKSAHTYTFTVFETSFASVMPDITLIDVDLGELSAELSGIERVRLEGDFNKYFTLMVPKGYEIEAYQIFTPDVMTDLIDRAQKLCFEFCGDKLYICALKIMTNRQDFDRIFSLTSYLDDLLAKNVADMKVYTPAELAENGTSGNRGSGSFL